MASYPHISVPEAIQHCTVLTFGSVRPILTPLRSIQMSHFTRSLQSNINLCRLLLSLPLPQTEVWGQSSVRYHMYPNTHIPTVKSAVFLTSWKPPCPAFTSFTEHTIYCIFKLDKHLNFPRVTDTCFLVFLCIYPLLCCTQEPTPRSTHNSPSNSGTAIN